MTPLFPNSKLETDRYNSELDQSDTELDSYNECGNESENDEDIENIGKEYIEVESNEDDFPFDTLSLEDLANLEKLGENLLNHPEDPEKLLEEPEVMGRLIKTYECYVDLLQTRSRTVKFWLQYQRYVNVLKSFIRAERTGNWSLHLQSMSNMINWFAAKPCLKSLSAGIVATEGINCDDAETVGENIQKSLDNLTVEEAKISKKDHIKTLDTLQTGIVIDSKTVYIDTLIHFTRLAAIIQRDGCVADHFKYELTPEARSFFKGGYMGKPAKSSLRNYILKKAERNITSLSVSCIIGGGALLHKVN